jgi:hypothetical protein
MEDLGERVGRKPARAVGSDLPSGTAPPADSTPLLLSFTLPTLARKLVPRFVAAERAEVLPLGASG